MFSFSKFEFIIIFSRGISSKELNKFIADKNENLSFGARPIRRIITREIEDKLSDEMLKGEIKRGDRLSVCFKDDELIFAHK